MTTRRDNTASERVMVGSVNALGSQNFGPTPEDRPPDSNERPTKSLGDLAYYAATTARIQLEHKIPGFDTHFLRIATEGFLATQPLLAAATGAFVGLIGMAKSNLLTLAATEFILAKAVDYGISKRIRGQGKCGEIFYASMSRAGLESGLDGEEVYLKSTLGGVSLTNTGFTDLSIGQLIGWEIRQAALKNPAIQKLMESGVITEESLGPVLARALAVLARVVEIPETLESPISVNLVRALREEHDPDTTAAARKHAFESKPRFAAMGTMLGHAVSGSAVGMLLGHPLAGFAVGAVDSVVDALFMSAAMEGRVATVSTVKARSVSQGWDGQEPGINDALANFYAPARGELVAAGADLRSVLELNIDRIGEKLESGAETLSVGILSALLGELARQMPGGDESEALNTVTARVARHFVAGEAARSLHEKHFPKEQVREAVDEILYQVIEEISETLQNTSGLSLGEALQRDFPELDELQKRASQDVGRGLGHLSSAIQNIRSKKAPDDDQLP